MGGPATDFARSSMATTLGSDAATIMLLHCSKYPHRAVNGVLLGTAEGEGQVSITCALPFFHGLLGLAPMLEVALAQVRVALVPPALRGWSTPTSPPSPPQTPPFGARGAAQADVYATSLGLAIVGYYHANEVKGDNELGHVARKVGEKIHARCPAACIVIVDGSRAPTLASGQQLPVKVFGLSGSVWQQRDSGAVKVEKADEATALLSSCLSEGAQYHLVDFDDHLDDVQRSWLGQRPSILLEKCRAGS